jgi:adenine-specific DNA-methyltransferase
MVATNLSNLKKLLADLGEQIGSPYYADDKCAIFCVDTLSAQKRLPKHIFNLVITSPPYNIGKEYESVKQLNEYVAWSKSWINDTCNLLSKNGAFLLNLGYMSVDEKGRAIPLPYLLWNEVPLYLNQEIVWNYSAGVACKNYLSPRNEKILWYVKDCENYTFNLDSIRDKNVKYPNQKKNGKIRVNPLGKNPSDVWQIAKVTSGKNRASLERTPHPCQFPTGLTDRLVTAFSNYNDIVFDPFLGSGTTMESCIKNNRYCIGFEIRADYCEIAKKRIIKANEKKEKEYGIAL